MRILRTLGVAVDCAHVHAPPLGDHDVHIWTARLKATPSQFESLERTLSRDEHERAGRFHFERHRTAFVAARAALRGILGGYLGIAPRDLQFEYGPHGKPGLATGGLQFNASHSGDVAVVGVTRRQRIGVDVEQRRELEYLALADHFFALPEITELQSLAAGTLADGFFNCWTRTEAYVKALGEGLSFPLDQFAVSLRPDAIPALLWSSRGSAESARWQLLTIAGEPDYTGAVVVERPVSQVVDLRWAHADGR